MHLLERINIELSVQKSIVPDDVKLSKLRVFGRLPTLKANFSDAKYKALMRFIDVSIPQFGNPTQTSQEVTAPRQAAQAPKFRLPNVFSPGTTEYNVAPLEEVPKQTPADEGEETFFDASEGTPADIHQRSFELNFKVDRLEATIAQVGRDGKEKLLGDVVLQQFNLGFGLAMFDMRVDISLR